MTPQPEFSRPFRIDSLPATPRPFSIEANRAEREALARRFDLVDIQRLEAEGMLSRRGDDVIAAGSLSASVTQSCVATGTAVPAEIEEEFEVIFRPQPEGISEDEEIELSGSEMDVVFYNGSSIDVGEAVAETLSLSLDPYPRAPEADEALREAGVKTEEEAGPAGPLAGLKDLLSGKTAK